MSDSLQLHGLSKQVSSVGLGPLSLDIRLIHARLLSCVRLFKATWTVALQAPLSVGFSGQEYWSGLPFPSLGDLSDPGFKTVSCISCIASGFFTFG